ncbi:hypothetical protein [Frankia sp. Cj5]|uniref:hypothetical protein n=1 Tax=Frankia sp. Cj5 TaxID=2880978 RepID=UPI001EF74F66|nr:hypothetical protein [Frankia sp. Cj5]
MRRNATYQDLHEDFEIGGTTAWDYDQPMVKFLAHAFGHPDEGDQEEFLTMLLEGTVCLIDGTLCRRYAGGTARICRPASSVATALTSDASSICPAG